MPRQSGTSCLREVDDGRAHIRAGAYLGLGENPPSSAEITSIVLKRCGTS